MSLRTGTDSFRTCPPDDSQSVRGSFTLTDDSIYQYSRSRVQRRNQAQQWTYQKKLQGQSNNHKDETKVTISEDLANGQSAKLDTYLKFLSKGELRLGIPSDEPGGEIQPDGTQSLRLPNLDQLVQPTRLSDLLSPIAEEDKVAWDLATLRPRRPISRHMASRAQVQELATKESSLDSEKTQVTPSMPTKRPTISTTPATKKRRRSSRQQALLDNENEAVEVINGIDSKSNYGRLVEHMPPHFDLVYRISCSNSQPSSHPVLFFRDTPVLETIWNAEDQLPWEDLPHLNGKVPILDLEAFMSNERDDIAFVIIRTVECCGTSVLKARSGLSLGWTESIYAKSKMSKNAMQQIATCYFRTISDPITDSSRHRITLRSFGQNQITPFDLFFFHHRHLVEKYNIQHPESKQHVGALLNYIETKYGKEFDEAQSMFARRLVTPMHVLKLFKPNELVVSETYGKPAAFVVQEWPEMGKDGSVTIACWSFQADGSGFARKRKTLSVSPLGVDINDIQTLTAYPFRFAAPEVQESIRIHGEKQWEYHTASQVAYQGWNVKQDQYFSDSRFMIDHSIYRKMHETAAAFTFDRPTATHTFDRMPAYLSTADKPSDISLLLLPPDIYGFNLKEKKWIHLFVNCIRPVSWNKKAFERLALPPEKKDLVRALINVRTSQGGIEQGVGVAGKRTDITSGKGNGLIMLLHGGPGTGKTLTAESVAEIAEMPLYRVTCGDIGINAEAVEQYLSTVLHLGKIWNCVLLLDEADVFLEERSMADLKRNSLVSVFLRILEYYDGILILTSNRVGTFDEAFSSRIQVALHYENLNRSARKKIWQNFIDMLEEDEEDVNFDEIKLRLDDLASKELNGRQIRNVLTTARQLAIFKKERLDWEHLTQALSVSSDFSAYLKRMQGHTDDQRARDIGLR